MKLKNNPTLSTFINEGRSYFLNQSHIEFQENSIALLNGKSGKILLLSLLYLHAPDREVKNSINKEMQQILEIISTSTEILPTHCSGLSGWGWLLEFLRDKDLLEENIDTILPEIDDVLMERIEASLKVKNFDLLHGAMGYGLYFLKRNIKAPVEMLVDALYAAAEKTEDMASWMRYDSVNVQAYVYDLGLAHGACGILYFLNKCYKANIKKEQCHELMLKGTNFILSTVQDPAKVGSYFPSSMLVSAYEQGEDTKQFSRLAWCYGDLGMLTTLFSLPDIVVDKNLIQNMLIKVSNRRSFDHTHAKDAGFCHGTSGNGYVFLRLFKNTNIHDFKNAAEFWLDETLKHQIYEENHVLGYKFHMGTFGWRAATDLLTGMQGVMMFVLNSLDPKLIDTDWDECFFLS